MDASRKAGIASGLVSRPIACKVEYDRWTVLVSQRLFWHGKRAFLCCKYCERSSF